MGRPAIKRVIVEAYQQYKDRPQVPARSVLRRMVIGQLSDRERVAYDLLVDMDGAEDQEGLSAQELTAVLAVAPSTANAVLARLVDYGLAERIRTEEKYSIFRYHLADYLN